MTAATGESGVTRAAALLEVGRPRQALAELARLGPDAAEDARAFRLRVEALIALDAWAAAARTARQGLALHATDAELMGQLGLALHALGDYPGAESALLDALAIDPFDALRLCRYALLCMSVGQLRKATRLVFAAAQRAPESAIVYVARVQLEFARGRDRAAERIAAEFVGRYPSMPVALALYGRSAALRGRTVAAYQSFARAVAEDPADEERARVAETLRIRTHPLLRPLRPLERVGPVGAWLATIVAFVVLRAVGLTPLAVLVAFVSFGYNAYSWVAPFLVRHVTGPVPAGTDRPQGTVLPDTRWFRGCGGRSASGSRWPRCAAAVMRQSTSGRTCVRQRAGARRARSCSPRRIASMASATGMGTSPVTTAGYGFPAPRCRRGYRRAPRWATGYRRWTRAPGTACSRARAR